MNRAPSPFSPRSVLAMLAVGAAAFLLCLYAIGEGWGERDNPGGSGHAASKGLNGYAALVELLQRRGVAVSASRNRARLEDPGLLVLTPQYNTDPKALSQLLRKRRDEGPTLVILPKWYASEVSPRSGVPGARPGWVALGDATSPEWTNKVEALQAGDIRLEPGGRWQGLGRSGRLPVVRTQSISNGALAPLVGDGRGGALVAFDDDGGYYPTLLPLASRPVDPNAEHRWALTVVAEPDLFNNQGLADPERARLAVDLILAAREGPGLPVVFDLTLAGLGGSENLLTLAFEPPFLAATLCLLLAALVAAWRGFARFGPPVGEEAGLALGKRRLARNGAALIERSRRWHLLGPPYALLVAARISARLGVRESDETATAQALRARGLAEDYPAMLEALRGARRTPDLLRAAGALTALERTLDA